MAKQIVKKLPSSETGMGVKCKTATGEEFIISQDPSKAKGRFTLWRVLPEGYEKQTTGESPYDLYPQIPNFSVVGKR